MYIKGTGKFDSSNNETEFNQNFPIKFNSRFASATAITDIPYSYGEYTTVSNYNSPEYEHITMGVSKLNNSVDSYKNYVLSDSHTYIISIGK